MRMPNTFTCACVRGVRRAYRDVSTVAIQFSVAAQAHRECAHARSIGEFRILGGHTEGAARTARLHDEHLDDVCAARVRAAAGLEQCAAVAA